MIVHPSLMLIASLDEREYNEASAPDVKRAFVHLAPTTVRKHEATDPACNSMTLKVNFSKKYWLEADKDAAEMWPIVKKWLAGKRYFVGENIKNFNKSRGERNEQTVDYREIGLIMAGNAIRFAVEPECELPAFEEYAEQIRTLVNAGTIGDGKTADVQIPSAQSLAAQRAAYQATVEASKAEAAQVAAEQVASEEQSAAEQPEAAEAPAQEAVEEQPAEAPAEPEVKVAPMVIDYTVWGVVDQDGNVREFDSVAGAWL